VLGTIPDRSIDLCYLDPPFGTGRRQVARRGSYEDPTSDAASHLAMLAPWIREIHRVLRPHGSVLLHGDWRHAHRQRLLLEEVFGADGFVNGLVWSYGLGGSSPRRFARKHDDILFFAKGPSYFFEAPRVPARSRRLLGRTKKATDVLEVAAINNMARERCGWPTQKPLALLDLLIRACAPPGGLVLDPCCGSGTTLVAAVAAGRRAIGIDLSPRAIALARRRLEGPEARSAGEPAVRRRTADRRSSGSRSACRSRSATGTGR